MSKVSDRVNSLIQRSGMSVMWTSSASLNRFQRGIQTDFSGVIGQLNNVYYPLVSNLVGELDNRDIDVFDLGLSGNTLYADVEATSGSGTYLYDTTLDRRKSIKESIDTLGTAIDSLTATTLSLAQQDWPGDIFLDQLESFQSSIASTEASLVQLKQDTYGSGYTLYGSGNAIQDYPLAQYIDALGAFFGGFPSTGITYTDTFPTLTFTVPISSISFDVNIGQSNVTDLTTNLSAIRTFVGMNTAASTTVYSDHGTITYVSDGDSLEKSIQVLDDQLNSIVSDVLLTKTAFTDTSYYTLTTDGGAVTSSNIVVLPNHTSAWVSVDWVTFYSDGGSTQRTAGGRLNALVYRVGATVTVVDYSASEMTDSGASADETTIATASTVAVPKIIASGTVTGGVEFQIALTTGAGTPTVASARVRYTTVTNTGP